MSSSDYWLNRVGAVATASTPSGAVPEYGLALDVGTANWPDAQTFNDAVGDMVQRRRQNDIAAMEASKAQAEEAGLFQRALGGLFGALQEGVGFIARGPFQGDYDAEENRERGGEVVKSAWEAPVFAGLSLEDYDQAWQGMTRPFETVFNVQTEQWRKDMPSLWFDGSTWAQAWRAAEERSLGESFADMLFTGRGDSEKDLDERRRTNSLYGMTAFAAELYAGFKFDPTVLGAKAAGEAINITKGRMPRGQTSKGAHDEAIRTLRDPDHRYSGMNPARHYGAWRGRKLNDRWDQLRAYALEENYLDFSSRGLFNERAVNGPQAALAFQIAAKDDRLWDLTRRLVMADPQAWHQLDEMRTNPELFPDEFRDTDAGTFIDAIEATKTKAKRLQDEIADLEKTIAKREELGPQPLRPGGRTNPGFFEYHTWELHKDLEDKVIDLEDATLALERHSDYADWLEAVEGPNGPINVNDLNLAVNARDRVYSRTYQKNLFGQAHRVSRITRTPWLYKANSIDLHRPDQGALSIRRQFQNMEALFGYKNVEAVDDILQRFARAKTTQERWEIAQEVDDVHLIGALSRQHNLAPETIDAFLREVRLRRNDMAEALRAGQGAIYSTAPVDNPLRQGDSVRNLGEVDGQIKLEVMDNGVKHTMYVPKESLDAFSTPVDPTQTPQYYQPMDAREVHLTIKREPELFELLDSDIRHGARVANKVTMEAIDRFGTTFNSLWKPAQLFRLAWPQRVLMDEWLRSMAILGVSDWMRAYAPAMKTAAVNAINPAIHNFGIVDRYKRRHIKIGPGPLADEVTGRSMDVAAHEAKSMAAPAVPSKFAPRPNGRRVAAVQGFLRQALPMKAQRARARALLRNPNPTRSLADEVYAGDPPANWQDIESALANAESHSFTLFDQIPASDDGLILAGTRPEDFNTADLAYAAAGIRYSADDVLGELSGTGNDIAKIERFLMAPPELQAAIWNGDLIDPMSDLAIPARALADIADDFRPNGALRSRVREMVERGKKDFEKQVRERKSGKGHQPLFSGIFDHFESPYARYELMLAKELGAKWAPVSEAGAAVNSRLMGPVRRQFVVPGGAKDFHIAGETIYEPIAKIRNAAIENSKRTSRVFDPASGRETRQGYAVRVNTVELPFGGITRLNGDAPLRLQNAPGEWYDAIDDFIVQNQDFLGASGFRLLVEVDHVGVGGTKLSVVRYFRTSEQDDAIEFARHVGAGSIKRLSGLNRQTKPNPKQTPGFAQDDVVGTTRVGQPLRDDTDGHELYIQDENYGPIFEDLDRIIRDVHDVDEAGAMSQTPPPLDPSVGETRPVLHGTIRDLGERLTSRALAPMDNGRLLGPGFYTTVDPSTARAYGPNLYTIKGTHNGRTYETRELTDPLEPGELADLQQGLARRLDEIDEQGREFYGEETWGRIRAEYLNRVQHPYGWEDVLGALTEYRQVPYNLRMDEWLLDHLMEKGIGAWRTSWGPDAAIYVWFDTENLIIKPAYEKVDRWYKVEEWFAHPSSRERLVNQVPESRIIRNRRRDPEFAELETVHSRANARRKDLARQGKSSFSDPVYQALVARERSMMDRLGLEYSHAMPAGQADRVNWWTQINPDAPAASRYLDSLDRNTTDVGMGAMRGIEGIDPIESFKAELANLGARGNEVFRRLARRREYGKGYMSVRTADGSVVRYKQMFEDEGDIYTPLVSAAPTYARMSDAYKRTLSRYRQRAVGYKRYHPPRVDAETLGTRPGRKAALEYYSEWTDMLNSQVRNSPIWWRMLDGQTDDQIVEWLRKSHEGAKLRRDFPMKGRNPEKWVEEHRARLEFYLPDESLRDILRNRNLKPDELWRVPEEDLPEIYAPDVEMVKGEGVAKLFSGVADRIYHALGTVPTDVLSRQPYAKAMYDLKMRNLLRTADAEYLTPQMLLRYEKLAREFSIKQVRRVLYDLADEQNMTQMLRFASPFWGAQWDAIYKWAKIFSERPETAARFYVGINEVYDTFRVVNEDNEPVDDVEHWLDYDPNHRVILQIPKAFKNLPWAKEALEHFTDIGVAFGSANTALQGDTPMFPSLGPIITIPADKLAAIMWDHNGAVFEDNLFYQWVFPVGRPNSTGVRGVLEQLFPGWGKRMDALAHGQDSRSYMNTYAIVSREMRLEAKQKGLPEPTPEEVEEAVKAHFGLRVLASFAAPAALEFRPKNQFFLDEYHKFQREYGPGLAFEKFYEKYGADYTRYAAATSSDGLVPSTTKGMQDWMNTKPYIRDAVVSGNEDLATAFISAEAWQDDFNSDVYNEQFKIEVGPGTDAKLRVPQDPGERQLEADRRVGWVEFRQFMSGLNAELYARGLNSLQQSGAEDLYEMKQQWVAMQEQANPAWATDYRTYSDNIYQKVAFLQKYAWEPAFDNRPDIQGLRQYFGIRERVAQALDAYAMATGGSRSLQAQENGDLRNYFYTQVGALIQANPAFGEFYSRYLDADLLERGTGFYYGN